jgi:hypothetical protein
MQSEMCLNVCTAITFLGPLFDIQPLNPRSGALPMLIFAQRLNSPSSVGPESSLSRSQETFVNNPTIKV